jgi:hypothetical protein
MALTLAPFEDLKKLLDLEKATLGDYPALEVLQGWVRGNFEDYLYRTLEEASGVEKPELGVEASPMVPLKRLPVTNVASVTVDGTTEDPEAYNVTPYGLLLSRGVSLTNTVEIEYTGGYTDSTLPSPLARAAVLQVVHEYQIRDHVGAQSVQTEGGTVDRPAIGLLAEVRRLLDPYVHPVYCAANILI